MKKWAIFLLCVFCATWPFSNKLTAQALPPLQPEQDACNALELCGLSFTVPYSYSGYGQKLEHSQGPPTFSCFDETNSVWFKITVATPGNIVFKIVPADSTNDYDFAVFDVSQHPCDSVLYSTQQIRCNGNTILPIGSIPGGIIGLDMTSTLLNVPAGTIGSPFCQFIAGTAGQQLLILVDNFSASAAGFTIDFTGTTATFVQGPHPALAQVMPACSKSEKITVKTTKPVKCNSIATDGSDFFLTPSGTIASAVGQNCSTPNGYTTQIDLQFASPLAPGNYVVNAQTGTDGNTLLDLCGNALIAPDTLHFVVDPANNPAMVRLDTPACIDAKVVLSHRILNSTVAANGSDFKITGPGPVSVVKAIPLAANASPYADTIELFFNSSIKVPGNYTLSVVTGTDGNKVVDTCGFSVINTIGWYVSDHGYLTASATPNVLCKPGYVSLSAAAQIPPPAQVLNCGVNGTVCSNPSNPVSIGDPLAAGNSYESPFIGYYKNERTQMLFKASELIAAGMTSGTISQLTMNVMYKYSTSPFNNFTIKMQCTTLDSLNDFASGGQIVYAPKTYSTVQGTNTFLFDNTYDWDGMSNVIVEMCFNNNSWTSADEVQVTPNVGSKVFLNMLDDNTSGCALASNTAWYPPASDRPNITFSQCLPPSGSYEPTWVNASLIGDSTSFNTSAYARNSTTYKIQIFDTNRCYRRDTANVIVSVRNPMLLPSADTAICYGDYATLNASGGVTYQWYPANGLSCTNCPNPTANPMTSSVYYVSIADQYGCADTLKESIKVNPLPMVETRADTSIYWGGSVVLNSSVTHGLYYLWSPITGLDNPNIKSPTATPQVTTIYTLLGIDSNQCKNKDSVKITVMDNIPIFIPSAFTPNGDGRNDDFHVKNLSIQRITEFRVFNRWGQEVFSTNGNDKGWDGTFKGVDQPTDVYNYLIRITSPDGHSDTYKGDVTLIR
ncbi:gliding motility-associated C-terminal domain-containing protein [Taibaiella soli]|uniref:Gliding motility-associated C-terminal domain-containing protein n=1 Tax=Taibaiella soli TaxID=1649169 RepID=A0A2W2AJX8_9BACT|nr:gliding motility-associated C-terminal domain-containing protein [Taibaiella soli]PZF73852.1 hypothetical protein DN068_05790 [Taibaiella soli]